MVEGWTDVGRTVFLAELAAEKPGFTLEGLKWQRCVIQGPAVVVVSGGRFATCVYDTPTIEDLLWEIAPTRAYAIGAIGIRNCTFEQCRFQGVGFAGHAAALAGLREMLQQGLN